jgi:flagellar assembly protein FliH
LEVGAAMSLSKYYKKTNSFKPQELVPVPGDKKNRDILSPWTEAPKDGFESAPLPSPSRPSGTGQPESIESGQEIIEKEVAAPDRGEKEQVSDLEPEAKEDQSVDLENYIEKVEMDKLLEEAFEEGVRNGLEKAEEDYGSATRSLFTICQQLDSIRETIIANSSRELQEFAITLAERIVRSSLSENRKTIVATIEEALQRAIKSDEFTICVNPEDYDIVMEKSADLVDGLSGLGKMLIKKDTGVERGGARIESENCTIDATISSQFEMIKEEMAKRL